MTKTKTKTLKLSTAESTAAADAFSATREEPSGEQSTFIGFRPTVLMQSWIEHICAQAERRTGDRVSVGEMTKRLAILCACAFDLDAHDVIAELAKHKRTIQTPAGHVQISAADRFVHTCIDLRTMLIEKGLDDAPSREQVHALFDFAEDLALKSRVGKLRATVAAARAKGKKK